MNLTKTSLQSKKKTIIKKKKKKIFFIIYEKTLNLKFKLKI